MLRQPSIFDARRARGFARTAIQAFVDVLYEAFRYRKLTLVYQNHLPDPPARRKNVWGIEGLLQPQLKRPIREGRSLSRNAVLHTQRGVENGGVAVVGSNKLIHLQRHSRECGKRGVILSLP